MKITLEEFQEASRGRTVAAGIRPEPYSRGLTKYLRESFVLDLSSEKGLQASRVFVRLPTHSAPISANR